MLEIIKANLVKDSIFFLKCDSFQLKLILKYALPVLPSSGEIMRIINLTNNNLTARSGWKSERRQLATLQLQQ